MQRVYFGDKGTARRHLRNAPFTGGGKTGTAQAAILMQNYGEALEL